MFHHITYKGRRIRPAIATALEVFTAITLYALLVAMFTAQLLN